MIVHHGKKSGEPHNTLKDARHLCKFKDVLIVSPNMAMTEFAMEAFCAMLYNTSIEFDKDIKEMWVHPKKFNKVYFTEWSRTRETNFFKGMDVFVLIDELGMIISQMFPRENAKVMSVNLDSSKIDLEWIETLS